ncbi:MAG TPA: hydrogenase expression/formation protein HypE [Rectinemataceae bacterium]|nr:hydrogenase expression/formation protein HypE [Rectinemataceae bacterium]
MSDANDGRCVTLEHGSGGALSRELVETLIYPRFGGEEYPELSDATRFSLSGPLCLTTDSYTVDPPFFPGSDLGRLAVFGTCNDLAVSGARPRFLSLGLIIEEGFPFSDLERILDSLRDAAREAGVAVLTGDTKVVPRGKGGGLYINTSGIGEADARARLSAKAIRPGDAVIVSGPVGAHGIAVLAARERLSVGGGIRSDCAFLYPLCRPLLELGGELRFMRDATRGGLAAVLGEAALDSGLGLEVSESGVPVDDDVRTVAEILGLHPLEIANEGVFAAIVSRNVADRALASLRAVPLGARASIVGSVVEAHPGVVALETAIGGRRVLGLPRGLLLPRIC